MAGILEYIRSHPLVLASVIVASSLLAGVIVDLIVIQVLRRLASKTKTDVDDKIIAALKKPVFLTVVLIGIGAAFHVVTQNETVRYVGDSLASTVIVILWAGVGLSIAKALLTALARRAETGGLVQPRTLPVFEIAIKILVFGGAAYGLMKSWDVDVTAWLASAGILGIAIGFAAKDTLANLFSGIFIIADAPYKIGDFIVLGSGERGRVTDIGIRTTRMITRDDLQIIMPNAVMANAKIINESGGRDTDEMRRVRVDVGVAYGSDIDKVRAVLEDIAEKSVYLVSDPKPNVRMRAFGASSLEFQLRGWIEEPVLHGRAVDELLTQIYKRFNAEGIEIPFPQTDVHLKKD